VTSLSVPDTMGTRDLRASICIIGAGLVGLTIADRLIASGKPVVVLESGPLKPDPEDQDFNEIDAVSRPYASATRGRYRGLGGSGIRWGGRFLPLASHEIGPRPYLGLDPWPLDVSTIAQYQAEVDDLFGLPHSPFGDEARYILPRGSACPVSDQDIGVRFPKWAPFSRCNLGITVGPRLQAAPNIDVHTATTVCDFELDAVAGRLTRVVARDARGQKLSVAADEFVLACGTIESTRMLLVLDQRMSGAVFRGCEALGHYLQDHLGAKVADMDIANTTAANRMFGYRFEGSVRRNAHLELSPAAQEEAMSGAAFAHVITTPTAQSSTAVVKQFLRGRQSGAFRPSREDFARVVRDVPTLVVGAKWRFVDRQHYWPADLKHSMFVWIEQLPATTNRISLSDRIDRFGMPLAQVEWQPIPSDETTFRAAIRKLRSYWDRHHLDRLCRLRWTPEASDETLSIVDGATEVFHPSGTTRMGRDSRSSVVDPNELRCHRVSNLRVVSASVFPTAGSTGPTCTLLQLAIRAADQLAGSVR
jgi:choline dehydrogenase-like flavoprotein